MDQLQRIIENIHSEQDYQQKLQLILSIVLQPQGTNTSRPQTIRLLETIDKIITSNSNIKHKFFAIMITKDLFSRQYSQFISSLSNSKLLQSMLFIALNLDPSKRVEDKGRALDGDLGNNYITLILECLVKWSQRYPENARRGAPTKFRLTHQQLIKQRVVLPKEFRFFDNGLNRMINNEEKRSNQFSMAGSDLSQSLSTRAIQLSIRNSIMKIEGFFNFLDETDDVQKLRMEIDRYHRIFEQEYNKNESQMDRILNENLLDKESMNHFLRIQEFYHSEKEAYNRHLRNSNELKNYIDTIAISTEQIKEKIMSKSNKMERQSVSESNYNMSSPKFGYPAFSSERGEEERVIYQRRITTDVISTNIVPNPGRNSYGRVEQAYIKNQYPQQSTINMRNYPAKRQTQPINYGNYAANSTLDQYHRSAGNNPHSNLQAYVMHNQGYQQTHETGRTSGYFRDKQLTVEAEKGHMLIRQMMSKVTTSSKGFAQIKKQLDQERSLSNRSRNPNRTRRSKSPRPMSRYRKFQQQSHFSASRDMSRVDPVQISPVKVTKNDYSGILVHPLKYDMSDMSRDQGWKKYRKANFKSKGILFQNQQIQIGYKSQAVYEDLESFHIFIKIGLFIGNKVNDAITKVQTDYQGDETSIMYTNPKKIEQNILKGQQVKQDLVIVPLQFPFNPISCALQYSLKRQSRTVIFYLPNSILKLCVAQPITVPNFNEYYQSARINQYRSNIFKLSKDWPHSTLQKMFDNSVVLSDYQMFLNQKSYSQYIIGFYFEVLEAENYLWKLVVRPDLTAVIQMVIVDPTKQSIDYGTSLLQTLQMLLEAQDEYQ